MKPKESSPWSLNGLSLILRTTASVTMPKSCVYSIFSPPAAELNLNSNLLVCPSRYQGLATGISVCFISQYPGCHPSSAEKPRLCGFLRQDYQFLSELNAIHHPVCPVAHIQSICLPTHVARISIQLSKRQDERFVSRNPGPGRLGL